jgi:energy-coupling factor transporter transmembrane protein EcfT
VFLYTTGINPMERESRNSFSSRANHKTAFRLYFLLTSSPILFRSFVIYVVILIFSLFFYCGHKIACVDNF